MSVTRRVSLSCAVMVLAVAAALLTSGAAEAVCSNYPDCNTPVDGGQPLPAVTNVTPDSGPSAGGTLVTITVNEILVQSNPPTVMFGNSSAVKASVVGQHTLQATTPAHAGGVAVTVTVNLPYVSRTDQGGPAKGAAFYYCNGSCAPPNITSISPSMGSAAGGTAVTIDGTNLNGRSFTVKFGSQTVTSICRVSSTELVVFAPPAVGDQAGSVQVSVTTVTGTSNMKTYTYVADPVAGSHLNDNRNLLTASSLPGLSFLPSWFTGVLPGITGRVIPNPAVHALFWDSNWNQDNPAFQQSAVAAKLSDLVHSTYLNPAAQYGVGSATTTGADGSSALCPFRTAGSSVSAITLMIWITCEAGGGLQADSEFPGSGGIQGLPLPNGLSVADGNTDYVIFMPSGSSIGLGSINSCNPDGSGGDFGAFHFFTVVNEIQWGSFLFLPTPEVAFQTVAFIVTPVDCARGTVGGLIDNVSHELVESATDPLVGLGWIENNQFSFGDPRKIFTDGEASDICEHSGSGASTAFGDLTVERYWSNQDNACVPAAAPSCPATSARVLVHPRPATLTLKPAPLHPAALTDLRNARTYVVRGSVAIRNYGPQQPKVSSSYTIEQQGPSRALFEGRTKVGKGPWVSFEIVQVGGRRCERGPHRWACQNKMPALDTHALVSGLMSRQFSTKARTIAAHGMVTVRSTQGNVAFSSGLVRSANGMPMRLTDVSRTRGKVQGTENVVFDYAPQPPIKLPK